MNKNGSPVTAAVVIAEEALAWDRVEGASYWIISVLNPFLWKTTIVLSIVKWL
jgi:hypothetical protein